MTADVVVTIANATSSTRTLRRLDRRFTGWGPEKTAGKRVVQSLYRVSLARPPLFGVVLRDVSAGGCRTPKGLRAGWTMNRLGRLFRLQRN